MFVWCSLLNMCWRGSWASVQWPTLTEKKSYIAQRNKQITSTTTTTTTQTKSLLSVECQPWPQGLKPQRVHTTVRTFNEHLHKYEEWFCFPLWCIFASFLCIFGPFLFIYSTVVPPLYSPIEDPTRLWIQFVFVHGNNNVSQTQTFSDFTILCLCRWNWAPWQHLKDKQTGQHISRFGRYNF